MADIEDSDWVSVIEGLVLVFCAQFSLPGIQTGSVEHRIFGALYGEERAQASAGLF